MHRAWPSAAAPPAVPPANNNPVRVNLTFTNQEFVRKACEDLGYAQTESYSDCMLFWYANAKSAAIASTLSPWQFANHFGASFALCNKVTLAQKFAAMQAILPSTYNFHPRNFIFPQQLREFERYIGRQTEPETFIVKPDKGCAGQGIRIIQDFGLVAHYKVSAVCQEYIRPYLLNQVKFDLRIYVLVTSVDPLRVYIHNENMVRFCTERYVPPNKSNLRKVFSHLTNYHVNKENPKFVENNEDNEERAHKLGTVSVFAELARNGVDVRALQDRIDEIVQLTLLAVQQDYIDDYQKTVKAQDERSRLFEILGFDILLDADMKPWLIEVNNNTSLEGESPFDETLKVSVIKGALQIVDLQGSFKKKVLARRQGRSQQPLFDGRKESERALATGWRQLLPLAASDPRGRTFGDVSRLVLVNP
jgi:tubulin polyglutamylase TTLL6/13